MTAAGYTRSPWPFRLAMVGSVAAVMALLWLVLYQLGLPASLKPSALATWLNSHGALGPVFLMLLMVLAVVVGPIPTLPISAAAGVAFGMVSGTLIAAIGALAGALIAFYVARLLGREAIRQKLSNNPLFAANGSQRWLFWGVFFTRLVPLFSFALISYAAGVTAISAWRFALATFVGMLPMTFVFAGLGHTFELNPALTVAAAALILVIMTVLPFVLRWR